MDAGRFAANPYYVLMEQQFHRLHRLIAAGQGDGDEADRLRDEMDVSYRHLTDAERRRLAGLSGDLYSLAGEEHYDTPEGGAPPQRELQQAVRDAVNRGDWEHVLALLRHGPTGLTPAELAFVRA